MAMVITGNPGVGKHTISKEIIKHLELSTLDINVIAKDYGLFEADKETNDVDVKKLESIMDNKITNSSLIVGHLAPYVVSPEKVDKVVVLRKSPYDLLEVYKKREYTIEKSKENAGSEVLGIIANDSIDKFGEKVVQIDTTGKSIREVSEIVLNIFDNRYFSDGHEIDWLEIITKRDDLKKFFAY